MATGVLSAPRKPDLPGLQEFEGEWFHTGLWPHDGVDFAGKRVAVIGTGSSAIQSIPVIAAQADHVTVLQRTAHYSAPAWNGPLDPEYQRAYKADYKTYRARMRVSDAGILYDTQPINTKSAAAVPAAAREEQFEIRWKQGGFNFQNTFCDVTSNQRSNDLYVEFAHRKIRQMVDDPALAEKLCPTDFPICTKRLCVDTGYFATYNRDNVTLVDLKEAPLRKITARGVVTGEDHHEADILVFATGFDAVTGALLRIDIEGRRGHVLKDDWADGARSYLGLAMAGYPNLFTVTGPGSPSVFTNMFVSIEQHVDWIADCLSHMETNGLDVIEAEEPAQDDWADHVRELGEKTLYPKTNSWYMGANVPGKPRLFLAYVAGHKTYTEACEDVAENGYKGFSLQRATESAAVV
jgi:cyclohexanone monooxygenase